MVLAQVVNSKYQQLFLIALLCNTFRSFSRQHFLCNSDNVPLNHTRQFLSLSTVPLDSPSTPCAIVLGENSQYIERQSTGRLPAPFLSPQTLSTGPGGDKGKRLVCAQTPAQAYQTSRLHSSKLDSLSTECNGSWGNNRSIYGFAQGRTALP